MNVRIVVADERQADFFHAYRPSVPLVECGSVRNPAAGLKDRDLKSDRPGRRYGGTSGVTHAGHPKGHHHGVDGERSSEHHELTLFAKAVATQIEIARATQEFDKLVIIAAPKMMGLLRQSLTAKTEATLATEISKDLVHQGRHAILRAIPGGTFSTFPTH